MDASGQKVVTFILPLGASPKSNRGTILFLIKQEKYRTMFQDAIDTDLNTMIFFEDTLLAGSSDLPVSDEAAITAQALGNRVVRLVDVGVSGLHRLLSHMDEIMSASVIIAVAGMEGALASVIAGLADCPVIAVPTSVGYGANFGGLSALLSMLNSCASGVSVVNIDNGFGAGYQASLINRIK